MVSVICHKLWRTKCPRNFRPPLWMLPFISLFLLLRVTVRPSDAFGLKARLDKKGHFPPYIVGEVTPGIIYSGGNSSTLKIYFSHSVIFCLFLFAVVFLLKTSDAYRFNSSRLVCKIKIDQLFKHLTSKQTRSANSMSVLIFHTTHTMVLLPSE